MTAAEHQAHPMPERSDRHRLDRRTLIGLFVGGAASALLAGCGGGDGGGTDDASEALVSGAEAVVEVGRRYRALVPAEDDQALLEELLVAAPGDGTDLLSTLSEQVRTDFAVADTVVVDGWILSRTEARAAALLSFA